MMKIAISGYGRMGKEIEKTAIERGHEIIAVLDNEDDWDRLKDDVANADVVIDFSYPESAVDNIKRCFDLNVPVVTGTTGWYDKLEKMKELCLIKNRSLFVASNFSIGVNIFFELNRRLAQIMDKHPEYDVMIEETHHIHKKDSPSGTAITLANRILKELSWKTGMSTSPGDKQDKLMIKSFRIDEVPGTHVVNYFSDIDEIELKHTAKSRRGFAVGAVIAAEWIQGKKGFFEMKDILGFN